MLPRRNRTTPFEVMAQGTRRETTPAPPPPAPEPVYAPSGSGGDGDGGSRWAAASDWWSRTGAGVPVVLRLPRGVAVLLVVALLGLVTLAYWVGHSRGTAVVAEEAGQQEVGEGEIRIAPAGGDGPPVTTLTADGDPVPVGPAGDPREVGRNYFVLATYPPEAAEVLATWLREEHGVATVLETVQNRGLREVIAVDRGFHRDELSSERYQDYERRLRSVGRAWQRHNRGRGDALQTMYLKLYSGS